MSNDNEELTSTSQQAADWWVAMQKVTPAPDEKREFVDWLIRGPERVEASLRLARAHTAISRADMPWPTMSADELVREALASPVDSVVPFRLSSPRKHEETRRAQTLRWAAAVAASLVVAAGLLWWPLPAHPEQYQTNVGELRSVLLADGSRVTLNTASKIEVRLGTDHRSVKLLQGEALFEVSHDPLRPFEVDAGTVVVRAVGTAFDIDRRATRIAVTMTEGQADMIALNPGAVKLPTLFARDRLIIEQGGATALEHEVNTSETTAWLQHQLVFHHRPLGDIAGEFNRYNAAHIEVRGASLRSQEMTGTFRANDVASFVAVLSGMPGVQVVADGAGGYIVTAQAAAASMDHHHG